MAGRMKPWTARLTGWGNRLSATSGKRVVYLQARIVDPETHEGRVVYIEIDPEMAHHLAERVERNATEADESNARPMRVG
ncbi:hypothetical protein [Streptomyces sp. S1D4-14]|uniref:hypothetical protein n=1 Tax=Streptomyces sp. S1D4-14 TaxID=2594461 RepID=UPI0011626D94|nr:hypothetical protein [Streptomyces sp. S1D4-14]QDN64372.1 hypothetical protein FNV66_00630 [Streptomyces sp. S1D4-14]